MASPSVKRWRNAAQAAILLGKDSGPRNLSTDTDTRRALEYRRSNGWSQENEKFLQQLGEEAIGYRWIYYTANNWYSKCDKTLGIVSIGFSAIAGTATFGTLVDCSSTWWLVIINGIIMFMVAFCAGMQNLMKYSEMARDFASSSKVFADLNRSIQYDLNLKRRDRGPAKEIIDKHMSTFLALNASSPTPPSWALESFKKQFSDSGIYAPMNMQKVLIAEESPATKFNTTLDTPRAQQDPHHPPLSSSNLFEKILGTRTTAKDSETGKTSVPLAEHTSDNPEGKSISVSGSILPVSIKPPPIKTNQLRHTQKLKYLRECTPVIAIKDDSTSDDDSSDDEYNTYTPGTPVVDTHEEYQQERMLNSSNYTGSTITDTVVEDSVFPPVKQ